MTPSSGVVSLIKSSPNEPAMKCFGCGKPCRDFGFWTNNGRVHRYECVNKECRFSVIPKEPEDIPGLYDNAPWNTKQ